MTERELQAEKAYRVNERLGILCGSLKPTAEQFALARKEADEWEADYRKQFLAPRYSDMDLTRAVNACCTCGGGGPGEKHTCPACEVYHVLNQ